MKLREDSEPYCLAWLGIILLSAYYFSFFFQVVQGLTTWNEAIWLMVWPVLSLPFFYRYFAVERGKSKMTMISIAAVFAMFYMLNFFVSATPLDDTAFLASWSFGSVIMVAGGFAMLRSTEYTENAMTPGIMDVSNLRYGPPLETPELDEETTLQVETVSTSESETEKTKTEESSASSSEATE